MRGLSAASPSGHAGPNGRSDVKLVITEKNDAAEKIAALLSTVGKPKADKVYDTPVYRFQRDGEEWVTIGLRGHILAPDFPTELKFDKSQGWYAVSAEGEVLPADVPDGLARPPYEKKRKPFMADGVDIKGWKVPSLPYLVWAPIEKLPAEKGIIRALKNLAKKADSVVIGTDFDREGELIGSDALSQVRLVNPDVPVSRARYSAYTKGEIDNAFANLVELDQDLADAGESRQYIDLIWGATLTRYLTMARFGGLGNVRSAGRVQTPTLALVVERERERMAFVPEDYWVIGGQASADGSDPFKIGHAKGRFTDERAASEAFAHVEHASSGTVTAITKKSRTQRPPAPFNTTSLQAAAAAEGLSPARTMRLAESLYMDGLISYPRVDNTVYPDSLDLRATVKTLAGVPQYAPYCKGLLGQAQLHATRGKQFDTDHPPIYPTGAGDPSKLQPAEWKLYNLVARRFLATLSDPAVIEGTKLSIDVNGEPFSASGDVLKVPGFRGIYPFGLKRDEQLPALAEGDVVDVRDLKLDAKQTEPPARYSQGKLIQEMERLGLGTKATRHSIIERLYTVKYVQNDPIEPSQLGIAVCDALGKFAPQITSPDMTATLEEDMNQIAGGAKTRKDVVDLSRDILNDVLNELLPHSEEVKDALADAVAADAYVGPCPKCGRDLQLRASQKTRSMFIGCSGWPECDVTYPLPKGKIEAVPEKCPVCGMPQIKVTAFRSKPRIQCIDPNCPTNQEPDVVVGKCPTCAAKGLDKKLIATKNPRTLKRFIRCENYDECSTSYPLPQYGEIIPTEEVCEHCGAPIVVVKTARGPWKLCPNFDCPGKAEEAKAKEEKAAAKKAGAKSAAKKSTAKKSATKPAAKKPAAKKAPAKKATKTAATKKAAEQES